MLINNRILSLGQGKNILCKFISYLIFFFVLSHITSCKKFVEVQAPYNQIVSDKVFENDASAIAAITAIYLKMNNTTGFANGGFRSVTLLMELCGDNLKVNTPDQTYESFYNNSLIPSSPTVTSFWADCYYLIYSANSIIAGLSNSEKVSTSVKSQLLGEAYFIRGFCHFYLVNLFGDVPYITTTDYRQNSSVLRTASSTVYQGIVSDLQEAKSYLSETYVSSEKVRPNRWAAVAMLSRVYLYKSDWANAESEATSILQSPLYGLSGLNSVFLKNSNESIWQLMAASTNNTNNSQDGSVLIPSGSGTPFFSLTDNVLNSFEPNDQRKISWINNIVNNSITYFYPYKYKERVSTTPPKEYSMILRLGEQYLIRAEARAKQNNLNGAIADLNVIRNRAGLSDLSNSLTQSQVINAIEQERRVELFTEWGHRWFDLKRNGRSDAVLSPVKPGWNATDILLPIPQSELLINSNLTQNPGY